jgi:hypothetical protein
MVRRLIENRRNMPYITGDRRGWIDSGCLPETAGELNYALTMIVKSYLGASPNYQRYNDVVGALECCKLEMVRRKLNDYENEKIKINGDVY